MGAPKPERRTNLQYAMSMGTTRLAGFKFFDIRTILRAKYRCARS